MKNFENNNKRLVESDADGILAQGSLLRQLWRVMRVNVRKAALRQLDRPSDTADTQQLHEEYLRNFPNFAKGIKQINAENKKISRSFTGYNREQLRRVLGDDAINRAEKALTASPPK